MCRDRATGSRRQGGNIDVGALLLGARGADANAVHAMSDAAAYRAQDGTGTRRIDVGLPVNSEGIYMYQPVEAYRACPRIGARRGR